MRETNAQFEHARDSERGAAMVMALLVTFLLLAAAGALLMETSKNTANVTDAVAEEQAYNAAESGIQSAVHVLRCYKNDLPGCADIRATPLLDTTKSATDPANQINYIKALQLTTSNAPSDTSTVPRLSRWLPYNAAGRVPLDSNGPAYTTSQGYAYSLEISDPDNTSTQVSFSMTGRFFDNDSGTPAQKTYTNVDSGTGATLGTMKIEYIAPPAVSNLNLGTTALPSPYYGTFRVTRTGTGAIVAAMNRFELTFRMTAPYNVTKVMRGWIRTTTNPSDLPHVIFDSKTITIVGASLTLDLTGAGWVNPQVINTGSPIGYDAGLANGDNVIKGTMTPPEPIRLLIKSTGYGPRGAQKQLQAIIQKNIFNGLTAPAALSLIGPNHTDSPTTDFSFSPGASNVLRYSGVDESSTDIIPPIGATDSLNMEIIETFLSGNGPTAFNGTVLGTPSNIYDELPYWLQSPTNLDVEIQRLAQSAKPYRYFASGVTPTSFGDFATGQGITFCDGDLQFSTNGGGILVVTGRLELKGDFSWNGLIIVTGRQGVVRSGAGTGTLAGNMIVAPYVSSRVADTSALQADFLAPQYDLSGGGNSTLVYDSQSLKEGQNAINNFVLGVVEK